MNRDVIMAVVCEGVNPNGRTWRVVEYEKEYPSEDTRVLQIRDETSNVWRVWGGD